MLNAQKKITRRDFMALAGGSLVSIGLPGLFVKLTDSENQAWAADLRPDGRTRIPPGQHAVKALVPMGGAAGSGFWKTAGKAPRCSCACPDPGSLFL